VKLLLDTHVFLWWLADDRQLRAGLRRKIAAADPDVWVSAVSIWEIAIKMSIGKLTLEGVDTARLDELIAAAGFRELPVSARHASAVVGLPRHHADPFDRLLVAQARAENAALVSVDAAMSSYDVRVISR
jgi:PIN domain nuclease of toxin-antitoxin system